MPKSYVKSAVYVAVFGAVAIAIINLSLDRWRLYSRSFLKMEISDAYRFDCNDSCKSLSANIKLKNHSDIDYCMSNSTIEPETGSVWGATVWYPGIQLPTTSLVNFGTPIPNNTESKIYNNVMSHYHIVLHPGSGLEFPVDGKDRFDISNEKSSFGYYILAFPCSRMQYILRGPAYISAKTRLNIK